MRSHPGISVIVAHRNDIGTDFSHWRNVAETPLDNQQAVLELAIGRAEHGFRRYLRAETSASATPGFGFYSSTPGIAK